MLNGLRLGCDRLSRLWRPAAADRCVDRPGFGPALPFRRRAAQPAASRPRRGRLSCILGCKQAEPRPNGLDRTP